MRLIHHPRELQAGPSPVCVCIGVFDGVHLGHQQILRQTIADAMTCCGQAVVITFDCHPNCVVAPGRTPPLIYPLAKKLQVLADLGAETVLLFHFDRAFSEQPAEVFIRGLARDLGSLRSVCVGSAFSFGHQRGGNVALLKLLGRELGFTVRGLAAVSLDSKTISSSRVRKAIQTGDLDAASQMLGRPYTLQGAVMSGDGLGRALGFPTANLDASGLVLPPSGVYVVQAQFQGRTYPAVVNIGVRPTIQRPLLRLQVEAHLLDFQGDLRGTLLEIAFLAPLRAEQKFSSPEALRAQIQRDIATARNFLSARRSPSSRIPGQT